MLNASDGPTGIAVRTYDLSHVDDGPTSIAVAVELTPNYGLDMGNYVYPLYTTTHEAAYHDQQSGGSGTYNDILYLGITYYIPSNGGTTAGSSAPSNFSFNGFTFSYTQVQTGVEAVRLDETDEGPTSLTAALQP